MNDITMNITEIEEIPFPSSEKTESSTNDAFHNLSTNDIQIEPVKDHRRRRTSSIISHVEPETIEDENDQTMSMNMNVLWINQRGAWLIHFLIVIFLKIFFTLVPFTQKTNQNELSWTLTNSTYCIGSYIMFHLIKGTPFDLNGGCFDNLTMWEQIDNGLQFTPARKFLIGFPICLFLVATHYSRFNLQYFVFNLLMTICIAVVPKLPWTHRLRITIPGITSPAQIS
ncbi:sphingolipid homeostasis protein orm1 [Hanseniaspora vineae]